MGSLNDFFEQQQIFEQQQKLNFYVIQKTRA